MSYPPRQQWDKYRSVGESISYYSNPGENEYYSTTSYARGNDSIRSGITRGTGLGGKTYISDTGSIGSYNQTATFTLENSGPSTKTPSVVRTSANPSNKFDAFSSCGSEGTTIAHGGWGRCPYQIELSVKNIAKQVAATKRIIHFRFGFANAAALERGRYGVECRGDEHDVVITWSITGGKRLICVDGKEVQYRAGKRANAARRADILEAAFGMPGDHTCQILCYAYKPATGSPEKRDKRWKQYDLIIDGRSFFDLPKVYDLGAKGLVTQMPIQEEILPPSYIGDWDESTNSAPTVSKPDERLVKNIIKAQIDEQRRIMEERRKAAANRNCSHAESTISNNSDTLPSTKFTGNSGIPKERSEPKLIKQERSYLVIVDDQEDTIPDVSSAAPSELQDAMTRQNNAYRQQQQHLKIAQQPAITTGQDPRQLPQIKISGENWQSSPTDGFPSQQPIAVTVIPQGSQLRANDQALVPQTAQMHFNNRELVNQCNQMQSGSQAIVPQRCQTTSINQEIVSQRSWVRGNNELPKIQGNNGAIVPKKPQMQDGQGNNGSLVPQRSEIQGARGNSGTVLPQGLYMQGGPGNNEAIVPRGLQMQGNNQSLVPDNRSLVPQRPQVKGNGQSLVPHGSRNMYGSNQALVQQRNDNALMPQRSPMNSVDTAPQTNTMQQNMVRGGGPLNPHQPPTYDQITSGLTGTYNGNSGEPSLNQLVPSKGSQKQ
mmetsp:Transcript_24012/g.48127  ORF Transcript_24012/g.48127 Transcript_24012/m.48127 type:complete len:716 (-) Transcript_24012:225-2372(-)